MAAKYCLSQPRAWCLLLYQAINFGTRLSEKWGLCVPEHLQKCSLWVKEEMWHHPRQDEFFMVILRGEALWSQGSFHTLMMLWSQHGSRADKIRDNRVGDTHPKGSLSLTEQSKHHIWLHGMGDATDIFIPLETALKCLNLVQLEGHSEMLGWNPASPATEVVTDTPFIAISS